MGRRGRRRNDAGRAWRHDDAAAALRHARAMAMPDPTSLAGKRFPVRERYDHVVVGAGEAGLAAATRAAEAGARVLLVDEHPLDPGLIGLDVPYLFGGRMDAAVQTPARMEERIVAARPGVEAAMEAGVEVALGTACWGGFAMGPSSRAARVPLLGLADLETAWLVEAASVTVAAGARDVVLPVPGWTLPGVMGAQGFDAAVRLYGAFAGRRIAVVGGRSLAQRTLATARAAGIEVVAQVRIPGPVRVLGTVEVEGLAHAEGGRWREYECDTVVLAIDTAPMLELAELLGAAVAWDPARGGFVSQALPPFLEVVGDAAGTAAMAREPWMAEALADPAALVCACEEVTAGDLRALKPPRYLGAEGPAAGLAALGPRNQDQVKRLTRAGMGPCQGRRCRDAVHALVSEGGAPAPMATHRPPLRPLPLAVLAALEEDPAIRENWTGWFGIAQQWQPHWEPAREESEYIGGRLSMPDRPK
jgi:NADPH-dependent 2,4-dienoyl-CoA reductase/sulfur reductase-like enzyme